MILSFKSRALKRFWERSDASGLRADWVRRIELLLDALDAAKRPDDLAMIGVGYHALGGKLSGRYAVTVSRNWRLTFAWTDQDAIDVDLGDYHGR